VQDLATSQLFALKKIRCPFGQESVALALRECEAYALFSPHPHIIHALDYQVVDARDKSDPGSKTVYILLPYYRRGNLQDSINANLVNHTRFPEKRLVVLFLGIARALKAMHGYRVKGAPGGPAAVAGQRRVGQESRAQERDANRKAGRGEQEEEDRAPLMADAITQSQEGVGTGEVRAYAHRDLKPGESAAVHTYSKNLVCRSHDDDHVGQRTELVAKGVGNTWQRR
jgi:serine/threonine kinase 16